MLEFPIESRVKEKIKLTDLSGLGNKVGSGDEGLLSQNLGILRRDNDQSVP